MMALVRYDAYDGDVTLSSTSFLRHNLTSIDMTLDSKSLPGYPLETVRNDATPFYHKFLYECNSLNNPYSSGLINKLEYESGNFIIVDNLKRKNVFHGQLSVNLKFKSVLSSKLTLITIPVYQKQLNFDEYLNVTISEMHALAAEKINTSAENE